MDYTIEVVENLLRNYYSLQSHPDSTFSYYYIDLTDGLKVLKQQNASLYSTIVNVFINGMPIQEKATVDEVSSRQVSRRLHDGVYKLTMIMNGELYAD
jgi:hypothetical protein